MRRAYLLVPLLLLPLGALAQQTGDDALKLLDRVAQHYQNADALHLEATITSTIHTGFSDSAQRSVLSAAIAPGGRFRYSGEDSMGSGLLVSNGTTEWHLLAGLAEYSKQPAGTFFSSRYSMAGDDYSLGEAHGLIDNFKFFGAGLQSAHYAPDETLVFDGRSVRCKVVQYGKDDLTRKSPRNDKDDITLWIDPVKLTLLKEVSIVASRASYGSQFAPHGREMHWVRTTTYTTIDFNFEPGPDTFIFTPPANTKEVAELPSAFPPNPKNAAADPSQEHSQLAKLTAAYIGKPLPEMTIVDAAGNNFSTGRYAGHPLLLDL